MDDIPALPPTTDPYMGDLSLPDECRRVLGHADGVELSLVWIDGEPQEIPRSRPDVDQDWADIDLPILLTRAAAAFQV
ncbi:hypothetical protein GCM10011504_58690 [Siccirubricoccus deserti]|uniref:Uncharacterized protein n=1 Tax=Siccirubricoccus deserti TaxID=2013562 RepID=A0A9X0R4W4_9PROT|nr:hypothetical protein [Siccirubricoccus deserti]MBC4018938.1 hypothetical protein [Siccirubricoccus deserti]GGC73625.1 hypothetical protein GCM10011504_58690 [Siccirubricoccus deserti]